MTEPDAFDLAMLADDAQAEQQTPFDALLARCDELGADFVPSALRAALVARQESRRTVDRLTTARSDAERDRNTATAAGEVDLAIEHELRVMASERLQPVITVREIDPGLIGAALGAADGRLAQAASECHLPALDYETDLALYQDLAPHLLRQTAPPVQTDEERIALFWRHQSTEKDAEWLAGLAVWRDVCQRQPGEVLDRLATAKSLLEQFDSLENGRVVATNATNRVNDARRQSGHQWRHPVTNQTQRQLLGISN